MKKLSVMLFLLLFIVSGALAAAPMASVTAKCLMFVQVKNMNTLFSQLEQYLVSAGAPIQPGQLKMMLSAKLFGMPGFPGLDLNGTAAVAVYNPDGSSPAAMQPGFLLVLPVSDVAVFRARVMPLLMQSGAKVQINGSYAYVSPFAWVFQELTSGTARRISFADNSQIGVYVNLEPLQAKIQQQLRQSMQFMSRNNRIGASVMSIYGKMLDGYREMILSGSLNGNGVEGGMRFTFKPGSEAAKLFSGLSSGVPQSTDFLSPKSYLALSSKVKFGAYLDLYRPLLDAVKQISPGTGAAVVRLLEPLMQNYRNEFSFGMWSLNGSTGVGMQGAAKVKDPAVTRNAYSGIAGLINSHPKFKDAPVRISYRANAAGHRGSRIDFLGVQLTDQAQIPEAQAAVVKLALKQMQGYVAWVKGYEVFATGPEALVEIKRMIDRVKDGNNGFRNSAGWRSIQRAYGSDAKNGILFINLDGMMKDLLRIAAAVKPGDMLISRLQQSLADGGEGIYGYSKSGSDGVEMRLTVSRQQIMRMMQLVQFFIKTKSGDSAMSSGDNGED